MTPQEVQALAQLLARTPMSPAESLWVRELLTRLSAPSVQQQEPHHEQAVQAG